VLGAPCSFAPPGYWTDQPRACISPGKWRMSDFVQAASRPRESLHACVSSGVCVVCVSCVCVCVCACAARMCSQVHAPHGPLCISTCVRMHTCAHVYTHHGHLEAEVWGYACACACLCRLICTCPWDGGLKKICTAPYYWCCWRGACQTGVTPKLHACVPFAGVIMYAATCSATKAGPYPIALWWLCTLHVGKHIGGACIHIPLHLC